MEQILESIMNVMIDLLRGNDEQIKSGTSLSVQTSEFQYVISTDRKNTKSEN